MRKFAEIKPSVKSPKDTNIFFPFKLGEHENEKNDYTDREHMSPFSGSIIAAYTDT